MQFKEYHLCQEETLDVFLTDLKRISMLLGGMTEQGLKTAFVHGLPEHVQQHV